MPRPIPTTVCHFTHIEHLPTIAGHGLLSDTRAQAGGLLTTEAGEPRIKRRRARRAVRMSRGGVVADYVPFYYRSRSPMLSAIHNGRVPTFTGDTHDLIYLLSTVETLLDHGLPLVFTDRNASLELAAYSDSLEELDDLVDWEVIRARYWANTEDDPDRKERRMAECLVHDHVPWEAFTGIAVYDAARERRVREILDRLDGNQPPIRVTPDAYF
ncbi:DUF4433 domain-containing protein [Rhodococcus sp. Eu-32]|uniref:type II toxin-antitoxin system toxin DNA ADP-ribosyl transferase DarT n=1 Tax=Rhodococcus sp. Eu-32 TaxID=1017319 RepID=UPI000DF4857F|nr:DUF4433 domain-containing protein [Rhodococcus sp. Eu-32]RRQ27383.1 DUF4433 domain-containing protein [Rhodococcus sp. Eu-32]